MKSEPATEATRNRLNVKPGEQVVFVDMAQELAIEAELEYEVRQYIKYDMPMDISYSELNVLFVKWHCYNVDRKLQLLKAIKNNIVTVDYGKDHPSLKS